MLRIFSVSFCSICLIFGEVVQNQSLFSFYSAMLCIRGTSHGPVSVSVRLSICHKSVFY